MSIIGPLNPPRTFAEVWSLIRALHSGLFKLSFTDNFDCFTEQVTIAAGDEVSIVNKIRKPKTIPSQWIVVSSDGDGMIRRGDTEWSEELLYLKNPASTSSITATVVFFR